MIVNKFLDPKNDVAFKHVFGKEKNKDILIPFLNTVLNYEGSAQISDVKFVKTSQDPEIASKKQSIIDVLCTDQTGRQIIVEMQVAHTDGFEERAQYYAAKAYSSQLNKGEDYSKLKEVIFIAITDYMMFPDKKACKSNHIILDKENGDHDLKAFSFTFIELPKFNKCLHELETIMDKWMYFFKNAKQTTEKDLEKIIGSDDIIDRAYEELNRFSWSEPELNFYEQQEKRERDSRAILKASREEGHKEGRVEEKLAIAKNMLKLGMSFDDISKCTGIEEQELQNL